ncbi:MAG: cytochrome c oxidase assembly factor Coa1 family protein [Leeuwenhoekiella sp.]
MTLDATTKTNWFTNNWKWSLPLAIILLIAIVFFSIPDLAENASDITKAYTDDQLYAEAWKEAEANERVQQVLGAIEPMDELAIFEGFVGYSDDFKTVSTSVRIKGSDAKGMIDIVATQADGNWIYEKLTVRVKKPEAKKQIIPIIP